MFPILPELPRLCMIHVVIRKMIKLLPQFTRQGPAVTVFAMIVLLVSLVPLSEPSRLGGDKQVQFPKPCWTGNEFCAECMNELLTARMMMMVTATEKKIDVWMVSNRVSYLVCHWFKSQSRDWLSRLRFFMVLQSSSTQVPGYYHQLDHDHILSHAFYLIIHYLILQFSALYFKLLRVSFNTFHTVIKYICVNLYVL